MTYAPFYGGSGSDLGTVRPLTPTTFAEFVKETLGNPVVIRTLGRAEFLARPKPERDRIKKVAFFTPAAFAEAGQRITERAAHCNLICIDIDVTPEGKSPAKPFVDDPRNLAALLSPFAFAAYTTAASTKQLPRLRIVVRAEKLDVADYGRAVRYVGETLLRLPEMTKESFVAVQPMFLPTLFRDDDPVDDHPLIIAVPEGEAVTTAVVAGTASPSRQPKGDVDTDEDSSADALAFLRPPVDGITLDDAESALKVLDPDCSYPEWIAVAASLKHQFGDKGFEVFDEWSRKGKKYAGDEETRRKWDTFRQNPRARVPVTIRSLLKRAAEAGWDQTEAVAERCYEAVLAWLNDRRSAKELMDSGVAKIAGAPLITDLQRFSLIGVLHEALKRVRISVTKPELKASLQRFERKLAKLNQQAPTATPDTQMPQWARGLTYVAGQDEFFQRHTGRTFKPKVANNYFGVQLMTPQDEPKGSPSVQPTDYLLNVLRCPRVDTYTYDPGAEGAIIGVGQKKAANLYIPTYPEADPERADYAGEVLMEHLTNLIKEPRYRTVIVDYMAYMVQHPGKKIRWAVLIQGAMGCGKTVLSEMMRGVLGTEHVRSISAELLFTPYNGWAFGAQLVTLEEIRVAGQNRYEVMNKLKPCISNDFITVNDKYVVPFEARNVTNYFMFTNHRDALAVSSDDRRYFVLYSPLQVRAQVAALGTKYFERLWDVAQNEKAGLRSFLEQWQISEEFNPDGHAPVTTYLQELAKTSATPLNTAIAEAIAGREHPMLGEDILSVTTLLGVLETKKLPPFTEHAVGVILSELGYEVIGKASVSGGKHVVAVHRAHLATLEECRQRLQHRADHAESLE